MLRNYLSAALGNIGRNGLYAGITILGLAVSFTAAILIGLYVRDEYSFDRFVPGHENVYRLKLDLIFPGGQKPRPIDVVQATAASYMKLDFPEIQYAARLSTSASSLKNGDRSTNEFLSWVDPDFFKVMRFPVLAGDPDAALAAPDGLVLTRSTARQYFGEDKPLGRVLLVNPGQEGRVDLPADELRMISGFHPMKVMAVLDDLPSSSHLTIKMFASGVAPFSPTSVEDRHPNPGTENMLAYMRLKPGADPAKWADRLQAFEDRRYPNPPGHSTNRFWLAPLDGLHFIPIGIGPATVMRPSADQRVDIAIGAVGGLVVMIAAINFVTLMTARAARRAVEVGVRKATGARRRDLVVQFMGEALIYVVIALALAVVAAELALSSLNAFLQRDLRFDYLADPGLAGMLAAAALTTALLAGVYPSLVLSSFRPAVALKGGVGLSTGSVAVRQGLVIAQFAILIGLIVMTATIYRQTQFVLNDALRVDTDQVIRLFGPCGSAFEQEARTAPGVKAVACASGPALQLGTNQSAALMPDRSVRVLYTAPLAEGFFELHGLKPMTGRFFSRSRGEDMLLDAPSPSLTLRPSIVLNESAVRFLGFASRAAAVGNSVTWERWSFAARPGQKLPMLPSRVIGVVPDFSLGSMRTAVNPTIFYVDPQLSQFLTIKLDRQRIPEALDGLRRLWRRTGHDSQPGIVFETQAIQEIYQDVIAQGVVIGACSGLAILIASLGLFALAAFVTERRTKEIGVRKAMGASSGDVVRLLLWQFTQPVLWANLVAWPAAFFAMDYWLHGFAYRVGQPVWLFLAATVAAAVIAWVTVSFQSWVVARARPATALRYE